MVKYGCIGTSGGSGRGDDGNGICDAAEEVADAGGGGSWVGDDVVVFVVGGGVGGGGSGGGGGGGAKYNHWLYGNCELGLKSYDGNSCW